MGNRSVFAACLAALMAMVFVFDSAWSARAGSPGSMTALQQFPGSAFTYQGRLTLQNSPVTGPQDFRFILYDSDAGGSQVGDIVIADDVQVDAGLFTIMLDFDRPFDGSQRWIEVAVRAGQSTGAYTTLSPRQLVTPAPMAQYAAGSWRLDGNSDAAEASFIGTLNEIPVSIKAGGAEGLRIEPSGRIAVGVDEPQARLHVFDSTQAIQTTSSFRALEARLGVDPCPDAAGFALGACVSGSSHPAVVARSASGPGIVASSAGSAAAIVATAGTGQALNVSSGSGVAISAFSASNNALYGRSGGNALMGHSTGGIGVYGKSDTRAVVGVLGDGSCAGSYAVGGCSGASGADGVYGNSTQRGVRGTIGSAACPGQFAIGGCAGTAVAAGAYGRSSVVGVLAHADSSGDIFQGVVGNAETRRARIDINGKGFFNGGTQTGGADYAESITALDAGVLEPGDVLTLDPAGSYGVRRSTTPASTFVVGVYSTRPAILAVGTHDLDDPLEGEVPVALLGIVPTKVSAESGPISVGDLLVSASLPGHAMKAVPVVVEGVPIYPVGALLGKAMEPLEAGTGIIRVLVSPR